jgi:hypothetical protein
MVQARAVVHETNVESTRQRDVPAPSSSLIKSVVRYIGEVAVATVGAVALGETFAALLEYRGDTGTVFDGPLSLGPVLAASILGCFVGFKFACSKGSYWVWVAGLLNFILFALDWRGSANIHKWRIIWDNFFSGNCGDSECLYELFATAPLYASLAYSAAVALSHAWRFHRK